MICVNCKDEIKEPKKFQSVIVCANCFKLVSHYVSKTRREMEMIFLTYTDMLRVALVKGELRPPPSPPNTKNMPRAEFTQALQRLGAKHASQRQVAESDGQVPSLPDEPQDRLRQAHSGGGDQAVSRRRRVRQVQKVQKRGTENRRGP